MLYSHVFTNFPNFDSTFDTSPIFPPQSPISPSKNQLIPSLKTPKSSLFPYFSSKFFYITKFYSPYFSLFNINFTSKIYTFQFFNFHKISTKIHLITYTLQPQNRCHPIPKSRIYNKEEKFKQKSKHQHSTLKIKYTTQTKND